MSKEIKEYDKIKILDELKRWVVVVLFTLVAFISLSYILIGIITTNLVMITISSGMFLLVLIILEIMKFLDMI